LTSRIGTAARHTTQNSGLPLGNWYYFPVLFVVVVDRETLHKSYNNKDISPKKRNSHDDSMKSHFRLLDGGGRAMMIMTMLLSLLPAAGGFQSPPAARYDDGIRLQNKGYPLLESTTTSSSQLDGLRRLLKNKRKTRWPPPIGPVIHDESVCREEDGLPEDLHHQLSSLSSSSSSSLSDERRRRRIKWEVNDFDNNDHPTLRPGRPRHSRWAKVSYTDAGTLQILFPAAGWDGSALMGSAFGVAWFAAVIPATFSTSLGTALFMVPFWAAGGLVAKSSLIDPFTATTLEIGDHAWNICRSVAGRIVWQKWGATADIDRAEAYVALYRDDEPARYELILHGPNVKLFGVTTAGSSSWSLTELERLQDTINEHLDRINDDDNKNNNKPAQSTNEPTHPVSIAEDGDDDTVLFSQYM
jgi:hypothetical protein